MKKLFSFVMVAVLALLLAGCDKYDDTELRNKVNGYEARIAALESLASYQTLLQKLEAGKTVTSYSKSDDVITLTFSDGSSVSFNQKGPKGDPGESVQGDPGTPGQDGKTPEVKIENDKWYVRYGEDGTWKEIGSAVDRSLIRDIKAEGGVLKITLADGSVVNVPYGEQVGYGFEVADGRRCFSVLESLESIHSRRVTIPYTLTGNLTDPEDVQIETRVSSYRDIIAGYDMVTINKTDAKTGTIRVQMREDYANSGWDGGEFYYNYPEMLLEVTAHFPDGTSSYKKLYIIGFTYYMEPDEDYWDFAYVTDFDPEVKMPVIHLPKDAGEFYFIMRIGTTSYTSTYFMDYYDGSPFAAYMFGDVFYKVDRISDSNGYFLTVTENPEPTVKTYTHEWDAVYTVKITFLKNNLGRDRYNDLQFWKRESSSSSGGLSRIRLIQAH